MSQNNTKKKPQNKKKNQQDKQQRNKKIINEDIDDIDFEDEIRKVNQDIKQQEEKENSTLTKKLLNKLPKKIQINTKNNRKNSQDSNSSDCSTPTSKSSLSQSFQAFIGHIKRAPKFTVDNIHLLRGYRVNYNSIKDVFKSLFHIHNESVNVWSHVLGCILVICLIIYIIIAQNIWDFSNFKDHVVQDFQIYFDKLHHSYTDFDESLNENILKLSENIHEFDVNIQNKLLSIHNKFGEAIQVIKETQSPNIEQISQQLSQLPTNIKHYLHTLENLDIGHNPTVESWKLYLSNLQSEYMQFINEKSLEKSTHGYSLQELPQWPLYIFLVTAALCLFFSATFHLFFVYKEKYYKYFLRLDYAGVSLLISGSTMPVFFYGFYCNQSLATLYISLIATLCSIVFVVSLQDFIHTAKYWILKSVMYGSLGIFAAVPMIHLAIHEKYYSEGDPYTSGPSLIYYGLMGVSYLGGLFVYVYRCPERYKPGHFDICGASHQIWHLSIVIAVVLTYIGAMINFYTRSNSICPVPIQHTL